MNTQISNLNIKTSLEEIPRLKTTDLLSTALSVTKGSHVGALVFNPNGKYVGVFYPYYSIFRKRPNSKSSISSLVFNPPKFSIDSSLWDIVRAMNGYHLYTIPILNELGNPIGIVTAKELLRNAMKDPQTKESIIKNITFSEPYIIDDSATIKDVYSSLRNDSKSRVVVVSKDDKIAGILTRRDMYLALIGTGSGNRIGKTGGKKPASYFDRNQLKKLDYSIKRYMQTSVNTAFDTDSLHIIIDSVIRSEFNSVVLTDKNGYPTVIVSTRSILLTYSDLQPEVKIPITIIDRKNVIDSVRTKQLEENLGNFVKKISKRLPIKNIDLMIDVMKNMKNKVKIYDLTLNVVVDNGKRFDTRTKSYTMAIGLKKVQDKLLRRLDY